MLTRALTPVFVITLLASLTGCVSVLDPVSADVPIGEDEDFGEVEVYAVAEDASLEPSAVGDAGDIWTLFVDLVTEPVAGATFSTYLVGDASESDTLAYVSRDEEDAALWTLAANAAYASDTDQLLQTLVHEYAHVLSLNIDEVDPDDADCATLALSEGCALPDSLIYAFQTDFWDAYGPDAPGPDNTDDEVAYEFYEAHEEDFVSDYAATNVTEDFAETFAAFVFEDEPTGTSPIARKIDFFWGVPEFIDIRDHMRGVAGLG